VTTRVLVPVSVVRVVEVVSSLSVRVRVANVDICVNSLVVYVCRSR